MSAYFIKTTLKLILDLRCTLLLMKVFFYIILATLTLSSCGFQDEDEKSLIDFHNTNYEFIISQKWLYRQYIERYIAEGASFSSEKKILFKNYKILDSLSINLDNTIDSCLQSNSFEKSDDLILSYNKILDKIEIDVENDKNYILKRFDFKKSNLSPKLKYLRIKNDIALAVTRHLDYLYTYLNTSCGFNAFGNFTAISTIDSNGTVLITLQSDYKKPEMQYGNMIIEELKSNNKVDKDAYFLSQNKSFYDIEYKNLKSGNYTLKGKLRYYTKKGIKDYPFEHTFKVNK